MAGQLHCPACGRAVDADDRFCSACAAPLDGRAEAPAERKLVSAVFVDLVDYTGLSESLDPESARGLLEPYWRDVRRAIERYGGTVEKFIGDAVVGLFGAPRTHEDDAARAVRAALVVARHTRVGAHRVRVGVATGVALVDVGARREAGEALVVGDVVTTAARLQQHAPPGGVLVDEATHAATESLVAFRRVAPVAAKGRRTRLAVWRALRVRTSGRGGPRAPRFVDRRRELALLRALRARVGEELAVGLVTIVGDPGIGKSRLVRELCRHCVRWEARVLPYGEGDAFSALAELLREQAGIRESDGPADAGARLSAFLEALLPDREERGRVELQVRRLLDLEPVAAAEGPLESFAAWRRVLEAAAAREPLVLVLEDLHCADDALLDFVEHVVEWAAPVPLLVVCTARGELLQRRPHWGGGTPNALTLALVPLAEADTVRLVADVLGRAPTPAEHAAVVARAGGNPLYAEQLARMLRERGELDAAIPETVLAVIAARLDRLPPRAKQVLSDASVLGPAFPAAALAAVGGRDEADVVEALHAVERMHLVERRVPEGDWAFLHRLVREVAYAGLPRPARIAKHVLAAEWLEARPRPDELAELVAHHYLRAQEEAAAAGLPAGAYAERARLAFVRAGRRALGLSAFASALRLYGHALDLWPARDPGRALQLLRYAQALWSAEVGGEAVALEARDALLAAGDDDAAAEAEALLSEMRWYRGDRAGSRAHLEHAVALVAARPPSPAKARVVSRLARSQMLAARYDEAIASGREALELAHGSGSAELEAEALNTIGSARVRRGDRGGLDDLEQAIAVADATRAAVVAYNNLAALLLESGDRSGSEEAAEQGRALAARLGDRLHLDWFEAEEIGRRFGRGEWDEALAEAQRWLASPRHTGYSTIGVLATRGFVLHARGDESGVDDLLRAEELARAAGDPQALLPTLAEAAFVLAGEDRLEEARARAEEALALCEQTGGVPPLASVDLAIVCCAVGLEAPLRSLLADATTPSRWLDLSRLYLDGRVAEALALVAEPEDAWLAAVLHLRSAELGGPGLEEALELYRRLGADRYVARCEAVRRPATAR